MTDLNIPVLVTWQYQDGRIGGSISFSSYAAALKVIDCIKATQSSLEPINSYWIESNVPELTFKHLL
jgi:hypothetical protein